MDENLARAIGARVRAARTTSRRTQPVVAGLSGITSDYLYQIERGKKLPTVSVLTKLAAVLDVPVAALLGEPSPSAQVSSSPDAATRLYTALTQPIGATRLPPLGVLHDEIQRGWQVWQTSPQRYSEMAARLPELVTATENAAHGYDSGRDAVLAHRCAVDLYSLLRSVAKRLGRIDLALLAADRAVRAAETTRDAHRLAVARWNLAHVPLADQHAEGAESVAMHAVSELASLVHDGDLDAMALSGSLALVGAMAAVRNRQVFSAREHMQLADRWARRTGERNAYWTAFGPTNVAMHAVSVEIETGDATEGLRLAERIDHDRSPSIERRVAFLLEQAKGHVQHRDYASTCLLLQTAGRAAPEDVKHRPAARQLLSTVIRRGRRGVAREAVQLADRLSVSVG